MNTVIVKNLDSCSFCLIYKPNGKKEGFYVKKTIGSPFPNRRFYCLNWVCKKQFFFCFMTGVNVQAGLDNQIIGLFFVCLYFFSNFKEKIANSRIKEKTEINMMSPLCFVCKFCCFTSQSTAMVMGGQSVHLTTPFPGQA